MSETLIWNGCYDDSMKDLITPEAFSHPAKMARGLVDRIFDYGLEQGYWDKNSTILDPFGGIGTTAIRGAYKGYRVISVELEDRFVQMGQDNIALNAAKLDVLGNPLPVHIQGDSRFLVEIFKGADGRITSPPFLASSGGAGGINKKGYGDGKDKVGERTYQGSAGDRDPRNVEVLPEGDIDAAISSPPYSEARIGSESGAAQVGHNQNYGSTDGQLGSMAEGEIEGAITSPPYSEGLGHGGKGNEIDKEKGLHARTSHNNYGEAEGQVGQMPEGELDGAITSPPYEDSVNSKHSGIDWDKAGRPDKTKPSSNRFSPQGYADDDGFFYGQSNGQIGAERGDTYWTACATIYRQVYELLPSGGCFAVVVKDFIRNKARVPLCDQTAQLLESIGFDIPTRAHAMLVKEIQQPIDMFTGEADPRVVERKSFFRRLHEKKYPHLKINYEEVIFAVKP